MKGQLAIITCLNDMHAKMVSFCLAQEGVSHLYLHTDVLTDSRYSFHIGEAAAVTTIRTPTRHFHDSEFIAVWNRRHIYPARKPGTPIDGEARAVREEVAAFSSGLIPALGAGAQWFNPVQGAARAASKMVQLQAAQALGMALPRTLIGNDPQAIRDFVSRYTSIYKSFEPVNFSEGNTNYTACTTRIGIDDLPSAEALQALPGIYQERIPKRSDVRLFIADDHHVAVEMPLTDNPHGRDDIRSSIPYNLRGHVVDLPRPLLTRCRALMRTLGVRTGSLDFVRDEQGALYFLEINPGGQFLWLEKVDPDARVLAKFLNALTASAAFDRYTCQSVIAHPAWAQYRVDPGTDF